MPAPFVVDTMYLEFTSLAGRTGPDARAIALALARPAFRRAVVRAAARVCRGVPSLARVAVRSSG
jgi:hypothetical protein